MLTRRIIPCLDVRGGRVVKGVRFVSLVDAGDPVEIASRYEAEGADEICFLDITASSEGRETLMDLVQRTADAVSMPLTVGGGVRTVSDVRKLLRAGADKVAINTAAVERPDLVREAALQFGSATIVVAIDAKEADNAWWVYTHGGRNRSPFQAVAWAQQVAAMGAGEILLTSMDRDGTTQGYDLALTRAVSSVVSIPVIASGGAGTLAHLYEGLTMGKADALLAASIFHYQTYSIPDAKRYLRDAGVTVRLP